MKIEMKLENPHTLAKYAYGSQELNQDGMAFIYFLFHLGKLVYVGETPKRLPGRLRDHKYGRSTTKKKTFDEVAILPESWARTRLMKEIAYAFKYKPKYNYAQWGKYWDEN